MSPVGPVPVNFGIVVVLLDPNGPVELENVALEVVVSPVGSVPVNFGIVVVLLDPNGPVELENEAVVEVDSCVVVVVELVGTTEQARGRHDRTESHTHSVLDWQSLCEKLGQGGWPGRRAAHWP